MKIGTRNGRNERTRLEHSNLEERELISLIYKILAGFDEVNVESMLPLA